MHSKRELIETARLIVKESEAVVRMAKKVAAACTDKRMKRVRVGGREGGREGGRDGRMSEKASGREGGREGGRDE